MTAEAEPGSRGLSRRRIAAAKLSLGFEFPAESVNPRARALREAWSDYLNAGGPWDWFTTHTFKQDASPRLALRFWDVWFARLSEACRQKAKRRPNTRAAVAIEWTTNQRVHLHSVIRARGLQAYSRLRWQHRWEGIARNWTGIARVHSANDSRATSYLAKYMGKGGFLVLRGTWPVISDPRSVVKSNLQRPD